MRYLECQNANWDGDCSHYLYLQVPNIIKDKVNKYLQLEKVPCIDSQQLEQFDCLMQNADILLYPTDKDRDKAIEILDALTTAVAILAFVPAGVTMFGRHYEVKDGRCQA